MTIERDASGDGMGSLAAREEMVVLVGSEVAELQVMPYGRHDAPIKKEAVARATPKGDFMRNGTLLHAGLKSLYRCRTSIKHTGMFYRNATFVIFIGNRPV